MDKSISCLGLGAIIGLTSTVAAAELREGRCHMDVCSWFSIESTNVVAVKSPSTVLVRVESRWFSSSHPNGNYQRKAKRTGGQLSTSYVVCSKEVPASVDRDGSTWHLTPLYPGHSDQVFGATESAHRFYAAVCHQITLSDPSRDTETMGKTFGYRTKLDREDKTLSRPEDALLD